MGSQHTARSQRGDTEWSQNIIMSQVLVSHGIFRAAYLRGGLLCIKEQKCYPWSRDKCVTLSLAWSISADMKISESCGIAASGNQIHRLIR